MNGRILLAAGLLLAVAPFQLQLNEYVFLYSLLGYGLVLLSFLFSPLDVWDGLTVVTSGTVVVLGLANSFELYYALLPLFFVLTAWNMLVKKRVPGRWGKVAVGGAVLVMVLSLVLAGGVFFLYSGEMMAVFDSLAFRSLGGIRWALRWGELAFLLVGGETLTRVGEVLFYVLPGLLALLTALVPARNITVKKFE